jgi:hypothetical protein
MQQRTLSANKDLDCRAAWPDVRVMTDFATVSFT